MINRPTSWTAVRREAEMNSIDEKFARLEESLTALSVADRRLFLDLREDVRALAGRLELYANTINKRLQALEKARGKPLPHWTDMPR